MPDVGESALVCVDKMDSRPGVDAVLYFGGAILPLIQGEVPQARLYIMGMKPQPRLRTLAGWPGMDSTGGDLRRAAADGRRHTAQGTGGHAMGKAVVSMTVGAEGLGATSGQQLLIADAPADFSQAVVALLREPARRAALGQAAREFVAARFDWATIVPGLEAVYDPAFST